MVAMSVWRMMSAAALGLAACGGGDKVGNQQSGGGGPGAPGCPETADAPERLAGVTEAQTAPALLIRGQVQNATGAVTVVADRMGKLTMTVGSKSRDFR